MTDNLLFPSGRSVKRVKQDAKKLKSQSNLTNAQALRKCAANEGIDLPWEKALDKLRQLPQPICLGLMPVPFLFDSGWLSDLSAPNLKLSGDKSVGIILGGTGYGKSVLLNEFMEAAILQSHSVHYMTDEHDYVTSLLEQGDKHPYDIAMNGVLDIKLAYPDKFNIVSDSAFLPDGHEKILVVIDEAPTSALLQTTEGREAICSFIEQGGKIVLVAQSERDIPERIQEFYKGKIGFMAIGGSLSFYSVKLPSYFFRLLRHQRKGCYAWVCLSEGKFGAGFCKHIDCDDATPNLRWNVNSVFAGDDIDSYCEYDTHVVFRMKGISTPISIKLSEHEGSQEVGFALSHYINTPIQMSAYIPSHQVGDYRGYAIKQAAYAIISFYRDAVASGHTPDVNWLYENPFYAHHMDEIFTK